MTLYRYFSSKENLIEEVLKKRESNYWDHLATHTNKKDENPLLLVLDAHIKWLNDTGNKGCMFLRAIEEYAGTDNQIEEIARGHKKRLLDYLKSIAKEHGYSDYVNLASQFILLLEGATSITELISVEEAMKQTKYIAISLLKIHE